MGNMVNFSDKCVLFSKKKCAKIEFRHTLFQLV